MSRSQPGTQKRTAKLTEAIVAEARRRYIPMHPVHGAAAMAREYGVGQTTMYYAIIGERWTHVAKARP